MLDNPIQVLLVDDALERDDRIDDLLVAAGFATRTVGDSVSATGALQVWRPSVVVVDLRYPARESRQFCLELAARQPDQRPLVILIAEGANLIKEMPLVPDGLVATPVDPARLAATIRRIVGDAVEAQGTSLGSR